MTGRSVIWVAIYAGVIVAANWATATFGLVPVGFGLVVTAGTFAAGAALIVRDRLQVVSSRWVVLTAVAGIATGLAQTNVHAADAVLSQVADVLGVSE